MSINHVEVSGNITRDPELRYTNSGLEVLSFSVAINDKIKNRETGQYEDRPSFIECTVFGGYAGVASQNIFKGTHVVVTGKLRQDRWESSDGSKRSKICIIVDDLEWPKNSSSGSGVIQSPGNAEIQSFVPEVTVYDEDIPF